MTAPMTAPPVSLRPGTNEVCLRDAGGRLLRFVSVDEAEAHVAGGVWVWFGGGRRRHVLVKDAGGNGALTGTRTWTSTERGTGYTHRADVCERWREAL
jgi:hypothetical protein